MNINPYLRISLYKITAIYMILVGLFETNGWREYAFKTLKLTIEDPLHYYLVVLFIVIWALVYLIERSFGLTMAAFRLRSRAGVAAWFDVLILLLMIPIMYASTSNSTQIPIEYQSDMGAIYSPFLIWFQIFTSLAAIQSLSTLGEYRFNRNQPVDPPQTGLPVAPVPDTTGTSVPGNTNPPVPTPVPPVGSTGATTVPKPLITPPPVVPVAPTGSATVTPVITPPPPVPSVGSTGATTVPQLLITPPPAQSVEPTGAATVTPPLITLPPETPVEPAVAVPVSESTPTVAVTEVFPTPTIPMPTVDPTHPVEVQSTLSLGEVSVPMSDTQLSVWERIKRMFGVKSPAPTQLVMSEVVDTETSAPAPTPAVSSATDTPPEEKKLIV